jgi:4-hydroxybenzoyl-CoA thioesterase
MAGSALAPGCTHEVTRAARQFTGPPRPAIQAPVDGSERVTSFTFHRQLTAEWGHCDPAGIVFNSRFFEMFDVSSWMLFEAALGVKPHELANTFGIVGIPLVDARANFRKPAKFGDLAEITSWVSEFRRSSFDIEHHLVIDGTLAVEGSESRVWAVRDQDNPDKIHAHAIPAEVIAKFS